ncbi:MAG: hypothetical protein V4678_04030 [Patescibacteria group bacterium]
MFDAGWSDDELGCRFELQEHREDGAYHQRRYFLRVYNQFTHGDPRECYRYNSLTKRIDVCDENWKRAKTKQNKHETAELVSRYLQSATDFSETDDQQFISIMAKNNIQDPRLVPRLKRLGGSVVRTILR